MKRLSTLTKKYRRGALFVGLVLALGVATPALAQQKMNISFGGSTPGGMMYYLVGVAGTIISRELPQYNITQVSTGGSTENCKRLIKGELDMGIVYGPHVYMALRDEGPFKGGPKGTMLRGVTKIYEGETYFVTLPDAGIKTMSDLKGKTVALGPPGSGTVFNSTNVLRALGILDQVKGRQMSFADAGRAVANRQIDAFAQSSSPAGSVKELAETKGAYVIPFTDQELDKITQQYPFYYGGVMKEGTYKGVPPTKMPLLPVYWVAHEKVPAKAIEDILALSYKPEIKKQLVEGHKGWKQMEPGIKYFISLGAPMHRGAEAYFKSKGLWPK
ncbi:MAG: TAXI family TRAP transporter solute-binding subunit [Deltaproteobacteria bacterium]|nr:TAXI family TRAP transporter solute-binding subunit [Deltaproteobacteria bacterium]